MVYLARRGYSSIYTKSARAAAKPRSSADKFAQGRALRGYKAPRPVKGRPSVVAPNGLNRAFAAEKSNIAWVTDTTYIRAWQVWWYSAIVIDLFSGKVNGWSMKPTLARELVLDAPQMTVMRRRPELPVIVYSDQGTGYGSDYWQRFCRAHGLQPIMSRGTAGTTPSPRPCSAA